MQAANFDEALEPVLRRDRRYRREAYHFVRESLEAVQRPLGKERRPAIRHVTGRQLLAGLRDHALSQFGPLARFVLAEWGIRQCEDFGEIVFNMVECRLLSKTDKDSRDDFKDGYDFFEAFTKPYLPSARSLAAPAPSGPTSTNSIR